MSTATLTRTVLRPSEDRIVVGPLEAGETTVSGPVMPDAAREKPQQDEVIAVGPGKRADSKAEPIPL